MKIKILTSLYLLIGLCMVSPSLSARKSLVPDTPSNAPDYFCTWSVQGYVVNYSGVENTRAAIHEQNLFGDGTYEGWVHFFPKIRSDIYFLMDDSWDIPLHENASDNKYLGLTRLDPTRFPSFTGTPQERLKGLTDQVKSYGWKGLGAGSVRRSPSWMRSIRTSRPTGQRK